MWSWFWVGFGCALILALPLIISASRRTERRVRRLERRARAAERLAELGTLTGGLAHEIKNPLSTVGLNLQLLRESLDEAELEEPHAGRLQRRLDAVSGETERLRGILEDFLSFAGRMNLDRHPINPNAVIEELIDFYAPQAEASGVQLRPQLDPRVGEIPLDRTLFKQALLNLLINASQAMVESRYGDQAHGGATALIILTEPAPDEVRVHVIDTGPGIDDKTARRMFQPFTLGPLINSRTR